MDIYDLTVNQLKRAAAIKEHIEDLNKELRSILGMSGKSGAVSKTVLRMCATASARPLPFRRKPANSSSLPRVKRWHLWCSAPVSRSD